MSEKNLWILKMILPFLPIVITFILIKIRKIDKNKEWYQFLAGGELFIFSTTICASTTGVSFFQSLDNSLANLGVTILLILIFMSSATLFGFISSIKLDEKKTLDEELDQELYVNVSIGCAIAAIFCSYYINFLSVK